MPVDHVFFFFEKNVHSALLPIFNWIWQFLIVLFGFLLHCIHSLYALDINSLSDIWFSNIFSHLSGCFSILMMISYAMQRLFSLMYSHLFIFCFVSLAFEVRSTKTLLRLMPMRLPPTLYIRVFKPLWLNASVWCKMVVSFFSMWLSSFPSIIYWRDYPFSITYSLFLCHKLIVHIYEGLFLISPFYFSDMWVCFCASTILI